MKTKTFNLTLILTILLFLGCSNNEIFKVEPEQTEISTKDSNLASRSNSTFMFPENPLILEITWEPDVTVTDKLLIRGFYQTNIGLVGYIITGSNKETWVIDDDVSCLICDPNSPPEDGKKDIVHSDTEISMVEILTDITSGTIISVN